MEDARRTTEELLSIVSIAAEERENQSIWRRELPRGGISQKAPPLKIKKRKAKLALKEKIAGKKQKVEEEKKSDPLDLIVEVDAAAEEDEWAAEPAPLIP